MYNYRVYSLSINSKTPNGSDTDPFLFLMSSTAGPSIDFGTLVHSLNEAFHVARLAVCPLIASDSVKVSDVGISPTIVCLLQLFVTCQVLCLVYLKGGCLGRVLDYA